MANSKASLFIDLFLFVFLSFQVLAHVEEHETNHFNTGGIHAATANNNHHSTASDNPRIGHPTGGVADRPSSHKTIDRTGYGYHTQKTDNYNPPPFSPIIDKKMSRYIPPPFPPILYQKISGYIPRPFVYQKNGYNPSKLNDIDTGGIHPATTNNNHPSTTNDNPSSGRPTDGVVDRPSSSETMDRTESEPENHEHGYIFKDDSMKPSEIDRRTSSIFMTKAATGMKNGDKIGYSNIGREDVGEQTIEDET